jgi:hypothetical protein
MDNNYKKNKNQRPRPATPHAAWNKPRWKPTESLAYNASRPPARGADFIKT